MSTIANGNHAASSAQPVGTTRLRPDEIAEIRQAVRSRRSAWAEQRLTSSVALPRKTASSDTSQGSTLHRQDWTLNVEVVDRERLLRGWTQRELARRAGIDQGTLCDLLARRRRPTLSTIQAICLALRLTLAQVLTFDATDTG